MSTPHHQIHTWEWLIVPTNMQGVAKMVRRCKACGLERMPEKSIRTHVRNEDSNDKTLAT